MITVSDQEGEETVTPNVSVAEEHDLRSVQVESDYKEGSSKNATETDQYEDLDLTGFDRDEIPTNFRCNEDFLSNVNLNTLLDNNSDVAHRITEIRDSDDVLESTLVTTDQVVDTTNPMVTVSGIPLLNVVSPTTEPL